MKNHCWIKFADRLPNHFEANAQGLVFARVLVNSRGPSAISERLCEWDWIDPNNSNATNLWAANGFLEWRKP